VFLFITTLVLGTISLVAVARSEDNVATFECFSRERLGLLVRIEIAALAWPGDNVSVTINATATQANIHVRYVRVSILSLKENRSETLLINTSFLEGAHLSLGGSNQTSCSISIPEDSVPGLLHGEVRYAWSIEGDDDLEVEADTFLATYIQNKPYQDLLEDYEVLDRFSDALEKNYTDLDADYAELQQEYQALADSQTTQDNATSLMYVFLVTTGIFVVTTILLLAKHPKMPTW
jgi:hypothetical protein